MNGSEMLHRIEMLIDQGNLVWESPGSNAAKDIERFCDAVTELVQVIYGPGHPYVEKHSAANKDSQRDFAEGMSLLQSIHKEVEYSSRLGH
ncbi:MAG: hypothetical protein R2940_07155 [Syntrophotaleaceae bacterium]